MSYFDGWKLPDVNKAFKMPEGATKNEATGLAQKSEGTTVEDGSKDNPLGGQTSDFKFGAAEGAAANSLFSPIQNAIHQNSRYASDPTATLQNQVRTGIEDAAIQSGNPFAMAAGLAAKAVDSAMDATGLRSDNIHKDDAKKMGISDAARILNNSQNFLPGNFLAMGGAKVDDGEKSIDVDKVSDAFGGTVSDIDTAVSYGGNRVNFLLGGTRQKMQKYIQEQNARNQLLTELSQANSLRKESTYSQELINQNFNRYEGTSNLVMGKEGMKMPTKLQNGGSILIPDGALHARKHNMDEVNPDLAEQITKKGIPVISVDSQGNVEQVAEIERDEMILESALTKKIEALWKKNDDESAIEAGKLIVDTLFHNCDDNTNLIKKVE